MTRRTGAVLLVGTILGGWSVPLLAQEAAAPAPAPAPAPAEAQPAAPATPTPVTPGTIRSIQVRGAERLEPATVISYSNLAPGQDYTAETLDAALKDLYATELFADVVITGAETGNLLITVRENPVINRIILEGNKRLKEDKIMPEIRLAPRQIFTRSKVRADVDRIIELYKRSGRFAATVEPKIVQLDQNRVDLVFEIVEGPVSKVRAINIIGNEQYSDGRLRKEMYTREAGGLLGFFRQNDSYDPDRLAADQQKLRAFYLTEGYADFRVVSALAELTPDRRDFVITYVVEEGPRYKFGTVDAESGLRDLNSETVKAAIRLREGTWFNAKAVEDTVTALNELAGSIGYAFADISPEYDRDAEKRVMNIRFKVNETPRVYVERIDINGNTVTRDKVIRREFRVNEGDAFNALKVKRSQDRLESLGYFQENLKVTQTQGSAPDRVILGVDVEEKSTGELQLSAGYSSLEKFIVAATITQRNFMGKGQEVGAGINWSRYTRSINLSFTEPYLFDKNVLLGGEIYRREYNSYRSTASDNRSNTYSQDTTGAGVRLGFPVNEFVSFGTRYSISNDKISLDEDVFFTDPDKIDPDGSGPLPEVNGPLGPECDPLLAGRYLCDQLGTTLSSVIGYSAIYDNRNGVRASRGHRIVLSQDFAGLGGDSKYIRTRLDATKYFMLPHSFVLSVHGEGGYIHPLKSNPEPDVDAIRLPERFFGPQLRGFDIRGIGPRVVRRAYDTDTVVGDHELLNDAIGGRAYYMGRVEVEIPVSSNIKSLGLRPSAFIDVGSVWKITKPGLADHPGICARSDTDGAGPLKSAEVTLAPAGSPGFHSCAEVSAFYAGDPAGNNFSYLTGSGFKEFFEGNSVKPRLAIGVGVNWVSPFGPLRIDIAKALLKQEGDETKLFSFNVGTAF